MSSVSQIWAMEGRPRCHYTLAAAEAQICIDSQDSNDLSGPARQFCKTAQCNNALLCSPSMTTWRRLIKVQTRLWTLTMVLLAGPCMFYFLLYGPWPDAQHEVLILKQQMCSLLGLWRLHTTCPCARLPQDCNIVSRHTCCAPFRWKEGNRKRTEAHMQ